MSATLPDVIISKISIIENCLKRIQDTADGKYGVTDREMVLDFQVLNLQRAIQAAIDIAGYVISENNLRIPNSYKMSFYILEEAGWISSNTGDKMKKMVGFRNVAVHDYREIDRNIVAAVLEKHLGDFGEFIQEIVTGYKNK